MRVEQIVLVVLSLPMALISEDVLYTDFLVLLRLGGRWQIISGLKPFGVGQNPLHISRTSCMILTTV